MKLSKLLPDERSTFIRRFHVVFPKRIKVSTRLQVARDPSVVLKILLVGTITLLCLLLAILFFSMILLKNDHVAGRILIGSLLLGYTSLSSLLLKRGFLKTSGVMLLALYMFIASLTVLLWSITTPFGLLLFAFIVVMAAVVLGARYAVPAALSVVVILGAVQFAVESGVLKQDRSSVMLTPGYIDVVSFGVVFMIIALVSWISGRKMEQSLQQALDAEEALLAEKKLLAIRLEQRTRKLQAAQLKEMQQLHRFAELGQLSTALLHDLANHLTVLTLDIEDIHKKQHSQAIRRAKDSIHYLDRLVDQVRDQLQGDSHTRHFNALFKINETALHLKSKAKKNQVKIEVHSLADKNSYTAFGDPTRFRQIITIIVSNAVDAYQNIEGSGDKVVHVEASIRLNEIIIRITDWGEGISAAGRSKLFKPFHSTKPSGMGIGLFIAKQMVTSHFKGDIVLLESKHETTFEIRLPVRNKPKQS